jgi:hypothetical protein
MVSKEEFFKVLELRDLHMKSVDKIEDVLNVDLWQTPAIESFSMLFDTVIQSWFTEEGVNHMFNFLYESNYKLWVDEEPVPLDNYEDLWNFVKDYRK